MLNNLFRKMEDPHIALELNKSMSLSWQKANTSIKTQPSQWQRLYSNSILWTMIIKMESAQATFAMCGSNSRNLSKGDSE
jgi:hypothetical protein